MPTILTCLPFEGAPKPVQFETADEALAAISAHLRQRSASAHKERVDLAALQAHSGQRFAQHILIPDELHASLRGLHGVTPLVMLPEGAGSATPAGGDAIVLFFDSYGALKGLPPNKPATMLLNACGLGARAPACGDCFFVRMRSEASGALSLGGEAAPQLVAQRDWLEAAQAANKSAAGPAALEQLLMARLAEVRRSEVAASVSQAAAPPKPAATAVPAEAPAAPAPTPPPPIVSPPDAPGDGATAGGAGATAGGGVGAGATARGDGVTARGSDGAAADASANVLTWVDGDKASGQESTLTVSIRVPAGTKAKNLKVTIKEQWLKVEVLTLSGAARVPIDGKLFQEVSAADCTWCVEDGPVAGGERILTISLEKATAMRWLLLTRSD